MRLAAALLSAIPAWATGETKDASPAVTPPPRVIRHEGVVVSVTSLLADPVAAFLIGRGFPTSVARRYSGLCVIRVVLVNENAPPAIAYDLRTWRLRRADGALGPPRVREEWLPQWRAAGLPEAALIGFEWSQFPSRQELHVGDTALGMVNTGLAPGSRFDLEMHWKAGRSDRRISLKGIDCAPAS